ncbi:MAG: ROK family protein [Bacteroidales bacterium]|nr:ROK family protein [Bacteroidales bacterium]
MAKNYVVGIDIGGQSSKLGVVDENGKILARDIIKASSSSDPKKVIDELAKGVLALIEKSGKKGEIRGIGVGAPNGNYYTGCIAYAPNLPWAANGSVDFSKMLSEACGGIPVTLTNDANAAALGERKYGIAKELKIKHFIMITLGTGVGSGIIINDELLYGSDGFAGELGHTCAVRDGRKCGCGKKGCLEAYCSAIGAARTAREWLEESKEESLLRGKKDISSKDVYDAAKAGDKLALRVFEYTGTILGSSLADFVEFSAPQAIVLFGGLANAKEFLYEPTLKAMNDNLLPIWRNKVQLLFSSLKEADAAILGASALAW